MACLDSIRGLPYEVFVVLYVNECNGILEARDVFTGKTAHVCVSLRQIIESAIRHKAAAMILAHNHPSGDPTPSKKDKKLTRDIVFLGNILGIHMLDHIIVTDNNDFSFCDESLIEQYEIGLLTLRMRRLS